ncbi:MAG: hypothetical protein C4332_13005 [Meiothermus sp.]
MLETLRECALEKLGPVRRLPRCGNAMPNTSSELAEVADYALAIQRLREGLPLALRTTDRLTLARYLETLAFLPPLRAEAAARLLGTASALRRAEVQARLEASSFQALWSEGEMLSPEQAAAEVLGTKTNPQP